LRCARQGGRCDGCTRALPHTRPCCRGRIASQAVSGGLFCKMFKGADDRKTFVVEKTLDLKNSFNVLAAIQAMPTWAFCRL
jgi:hypothetical protein